MSFRPTTKAYNPTRSRGIIAEHAVLRNTYFLLSLTLIFSAITAFFGMFAAPLNPIVSLLCMWGLLFAVQANAHNGFGIVLTFAFTGFMGYALGPLLHLVTYQFAAGGELIMVTAATTGLIFLGLSSYVLASKQDFSFMGGMLFALLLTGIIMSLLAAFTYAPMLMLLTNALMVLVFSGLIMFHTSNIIHGGERNYILATISLYLAIYNLFVSLLQIFMAFNGSDRD